jgi:hypothetical protein
MNFSHILIMFSQLLSEKDSSGAKRKQALESCTRGHWKVESAPPLFTTMPEERSNN